MNLTTTKLEVIKMANLGENVGDMAVEDLLKRFGKTLKSIKLSGCTKVSDQALGKSLSMIYIYVYVLFRWNADD